MSKDRSNKRLNKVFADVTPQKRSSGKDNSVFAFLKQPALSAVETNPETNSRAFDEIE